MSRHFKIIGLFTVLSACGKTATFEGKTVAKSTSLGADQQAVPTVEVSETVTVTNTKINALELDARVGEKIEFPIELTAEQRPEVKLVYIIDNSSSMAAHQEKLKTTLVKSLDKLSGYNVHVMLYSSSVLDWSAFYTSTDNMDADDGRFGVRRANTCKDTNGIIYMKDDGVIHCSNKIGTTNIGFTDVRQLLPTRPFTNGNAPFKFRSDMSSSEFSSLKTKVADAVTAIGTKGDDNTAAFYMMAYLMGPNRYYKKMTNLFEEGEKVFNPDDRVGFIILSDEDNSDDQQWYVEHKLSGARTKYLSLDDSLSTNIYFKARSAKITVDALVREDKDGILGTPETKPWIGHVFHCSKPGMCPAGDFGATGQCTPEQLAFAVKTCESNGASRGNYKNTTCLSITPSTCRYEITTQNNLGAGCALGAASKKPNRCNGPIYGSGSTVYNTFTEAKNAVGRCYSDYDQNRTTLPFTDYNKGEFLDVVANSCSEERLRDVAESGYTYLGPNQNYPYVDMAGPVKDLLALRFKPGNFFVSAIINDKTLNPKDYVLSNLEEYGVKFRSLVESIPGNTGKVMSIQSANYDESVQGIQDFVIRTTNDVYKIKGLRSSEKIANVYVDGSALALSKDLYVASETEIKFAAGVLKNNKTFTVEIGKK